MLRHYFKTGLRNLLRERSYAAINLTGLSVGAAAVILIFLFVRDEWTHDAFHSEHKRIYRAWVKEHYEGEVFFNTVTPFVLAPTLADNFPEIERVAQYVVTGNLVRRGEFSDQEAVHVATPSFLELFDFPLSEGDAATALSDPNHLLLTPAMAAKYFGGADPFGQAIDLQMGAEWRQFQVAGLIAPAPGNSSIRFDFIIPFETLRQRFSERMFLSWTNVSPETYVLLRDGVDPRALEAKIAPVIDGQVAQIYEPGEYQVGLQPLTDIHLNNAFPAGIAVVSDWRYPYILSATALMILLLAGINYVTLALGRSVARAKEVGVRKVSGATRLQLMRQFWTETLLLTALAAGIGLLLAELVLPLFNDLAGKQLRIGYGLATILLLGGLTLLLGLAAGAYPALILSGFSPLKTMRGALGQPGRDRLPVLRGLVGFQFVLSIGLLTCVLVMLQQLRFLQNHNLGFDRDQMLTLRYSVSPSQSKPLHEIYREGLQKAELLRAELALEPGVKAVTTSSHTFGTPGWMRVGYTDPASNVFKRFFLQAVDYDYIPTMGIELAAGRNFSQESGVDAASALIVNETMARAFGWEDLLDQPLPAPFEQFRLTGIARDFNFSSLHSRVEPLAMAISQFPVREVISDLTFEDSPVPKITVKLAGGDVPAAIGAVGRAWKKVAPEQPFRFAFIDEALERQYQAERRLSAVLTLGAALAIFIAALGLFGIATLAAARRTKEIGVRKVLGAGVWDIVLLLNKSFTALVLAAAAVAALPAWLFMRQWLADFAYRVALSPLIFLAAGMAALFVAWAAVSFQSLKAAAQNPADSLRSE
jgi:putative ABC transport system permease protein